MNATPENFATPFPEQSHRGYSSPFGDDHQQPSPLDGFFPQPLQQEQPYSPSVPFGQNGSNYGGMSTFYAETPVQCKDLFAEMSPVPIDPSYLNHGVIARGAPSSSLSTASGPSAPSSAVGSPPTQNDQHQEWLQQPLVLSSASPDGITQPDFFGQEYGLANNFDEFSYDFQQSKSIIADPSILHSEVRPRGLIFETMPLPQQQQQFLQQQQQQPRMFHPQQNPMSFAISPGPSPVMQAGPSPSVKAGQSPSIKSASMSPFVSTGSPFPSYGSHFLSTPAPPAMAASIGSVGSIGSIGSSAHVARGSISGVSSSDMTRSGSRDDRAVSRGSISAISTGGADTSALSDDGNGDGKEKQQCPNPDCGRRFKDLRAHMLTHQNERPEKCPIQTCEYHIKGFARKYDKNRHTLTHYKGTMVCGFCPGSGSSAEKSFNRADVFKRHLTAVHGVEQTPPNSRRKQQQVPDSDLSGSAGLAAAPAGNSSSAAYVSSDATGKCSTCSQTFANAQDFYEHLDDCVLRIVQQEDPAEAVNASRLAEVEDDQEVKATLEKNQVLYAGTSPMPGSGAVVEEEDDDMLQDDDLLTDEALAAMGGSPAAHDGSTGGSTAGSGGLSSPSRRNGSASSGKATLGGGVQKSRGMTHSRGGVPFTGKTRSRRSRHNYPTSWGFDKGQMTMRKRVMTVFDGPRRLAKDDMMLSMEHEVRVKLSDDAYVTDLDVQTLKRAQGFLTSSDEDKGPWVSDDPTEEQMKEMQQLQLQQQLQMVEQMSAP